MKRALFEPFSGIAGDMTVAAFLDLGMPFDWLEDRLRSLPVEGYEISAERAARGAFTGTRFLVSVTEEQPERHLAEVREILEGGELPADALAFALRAFELLSEAEAKAHGRTPEEVHFHEVGAVDAIVDVAGAALGMSYFGLVGALTTTICAGTGATSSMHGRIPVPAPGTMELLRGFRVRYSEGEGETTTPTGAALLAAFARPIEEGEEVVPLRTGYGAGAREDTRLPNLLRVTLLADSEEPSKTSVVELSANVDDQSPEILAHVAADLLEAGALDAWLVPAVMKKGRAGWILGVLAEVEHAAQLEERIFQETTTFGVRRTRHSRSVLDRELVEVETSFGTVRVKVGRLAGRVVSQSPEYEDCARAAREAGVPLKDVYAAAISEFSRRR